MLALTASSKPPWTAAMRQIELQEYRESEPQRLSVAERDTLKEVLPSLTIQAVPGQTDLYKLRPEAVIGALELADLSIAVRPKLDISRVIYLASYAMGAYKPRKERFDFKSEPTLVEALALALTSAARRAFAQGLLHGYRTEQDALRTVRGRIDMAEQLRRRFDVLVPVEVGYDEFTDDILANRLVKAAAELLGRGRLVDSRSRDGLRWMSATLANVTPVRFPPQEVSGGRFRQAQRALPRGRVAFPVDPAASGIGTGSWCNPSFRLPDQHERCVPRVCHAGSPGVSRRLRAHASIRQATSPAHLPRRG